MTSATTGASGLADRYAAAVFELADEARVMDAVADELGQLRALIDESSDLNRMIRSPVIARDDQVRAMMAIMDKAGMSDLVKRFVGMVARNRRLFALPAMIDAYQRMLAGRRGETTAEVVSARPLSDAQSAAVVRALKAAVGTDVAVTQRVEPDLIGGLVVKVGSRMVDSSVRTKLQRLRLAMKGIG